MTAPRAFWETEEERALLHRIFTRKATSVDRLRFAEIELWNALASLPPSAHTFGAKDEGDPAGKPTSDPQHASACVLRAVGEVVSARKALEKEAADLKAGAAAGPAEPGSEAAIDADGGVRVIFNGAMLRLAAPQLWTYERFVDFANVGPMPTITWRTTDPATGAGTMTRGTLARGEAVHVVPGMIINVA